MADTPGEGAAPVLEVIVPEGMSAGVYANGFGYWFNQTDFTLDFVVHLPGSQKMDDHGASYMHQPVQVGARIKFPPSLIFWLLQQLNHAMTHYETQFGPITPLGDPIPPPADLGPPEMD